MVSIPSELRGNEERTFAQQTPAARQVTFEAGHAGCTVGVSIVTNIFPMFLTGL